MCSGWILFLRTNFDFLTSLFWTEFLCYSEFRLKKKMNICALGGFFFIQTNIDFLTRHFWRSFFLFRLSIQQLRNIFTRVEFFLQTNFDFLSSRFWRTFFSFFRLSIQSNGICVLGVDFFSPEKFWMFN